MSAQGRVLVLGGTAEARTLAADLIGAEVPVISSLAGRVSSPRLPASEVRIGGFGGPEGLAAWLRAQRITAVVDATHPFAERISASAIAACERTNVPLLRLERPGWAERPGDRWKWVDDLDQAAAAVPRLGSRVLLTTGRQGLAAFAGITDTWFLIRCVDPPEPPLPRSYRILLDRGPYSLGGELALLHEHRVDLVVTKDSGGTQTQAKLAAARRRGIPVIVVRRPPRPAVATVGVCEEALTWVVGKEGKERRGAMEGSFTKNLLLRDKKDRLFLFTIEEDRTLDLKTLHTRVGANGRLGLAPVERVREVLDVEPGEVTPLALINDDEGLVTAVVDASLLQADQVNVHPLVNTESTALRPIDLLAFIESCGRAALIVELGG
jgi:precorrin-6A/cobalt-precorrin-6A reductase